MRVNLKSVVALLLLMMLTTGCLQTGVSIAVLPSPFVIKHGDVMLDAELEITMTGFGIANIESVTFEFLKTVGEEKVRIGQPFTLELHSSVPVSQGVQRIGVSLPISYESAVASGLEIIRVTVSGTNPAIVETPVRYEPEGN